jgi:tetratricopeptide (TPR) repeat protein
VKIIFFIFLAIAINSLAVAQTNSTAHTNAETAAATNVSTISTNEATGAQILEKLTDDVRDYEQNPDHWQNTNLIYVAIGYASETNFEAAITVYKKYLEKWPKNTRAIRGLGNCYSVIGQNDEAIIQFKKGWSLGDNQSLLGLVYLYGPSLGLYQDIKPLIPDLLEIRDQLTDTTDKHELVNILIIYSGDKRANPSGDKETFLKGIDGLSDQFILEREDTTKLVILGLKTFGYQERADKLAAEMKKIN